MNKNELIEQLKKHIELEQLFGVEDVEETNTPVEVLKETSSLNEMKKEVVTCQKCSLCKTRTNVVFGEGSEKAELVFVGEAPGEDEDIMARPFVGKAGQLLTQIIEKGMKLKREDVYICNVLKCRPPQNRNPLPDEIDKCEKYLLQQLKIIKPKVICTLGKFASQTLLKSETPISKLRGKFYDYHGISLMPTFHPAYLLRNPQDKKLVWEDIQKIMSRLKIN
ncbi:MAG: uracil-DNA glycosylase [Candidatus Omnitrophica bacterium]|nr:uracil-DNA glycosylase [Candidatus Omnitrophota bacterium]